MIHIVLVQSLLSLLLFVLLLLLGWRAFGAPIH